MKGNMKFGIILVLTLLCIGIGIWLPGQPFEMQEDSKEMKNVEQVPQEYLASSTAVSRNASLNLKTEEKIGLICGTWDSVNKRITVSDMEQKEYQAVKIARTAVKKLYDAGLYPEDISSLYSNWYSWKTEAYEAVDTTFQTYAAYYWKITFVKYDETETHTIWMLEDGTVILAQELTKQPVGKEEAECTQDSISLDIAGKTWTSKIQTPVDFSDVKTKLSYSGIIPVSSQSSRQVQVTDKDEGQLQIVQFSSEKQYIYGLIP